MFYIPLPDYHSNRTHLYYKTDNLTKFSPAVNRAESDSYMKLKFFYKDYFRRNKGCFTEILLKILIKAKSKLTFALIFYNFSRILVFSSPVFDR